MTTPDVTLSHAADAAGGRYVATVAGEQVTGYLEWELGPMPDIRIAAHTVVPPAISGRGIAALLVDRLVADAREHGFRIDPQCSYVAKKFAAHPDWDNLRA